MAAASPYMPGISRFVAEQEAGDDANEQRFGVGVVDIVLMKGARGLGFTVIDDPRGVLVHSIKAEGAAYGKLQPQDKILFVNHIDVRQWQLPDIVNLIKNTSRGPVPMTVARLAALDDEGQAIHDADPEEARGSSGSSGAVTAVPGGALTIVRSHSSSLSHNNASPHGAPEHKKQAPHLSRLASSATTPSPESFPLDSQEQGHANSPSHASSQAPSSDVATAAAKHAQQQGRTPSIEHGGHGRAADTPARATKDSAGAGETLVARLRLERNGATGLTLGGGVPSPDGGHSQVVIKEVRPDSPASQAELLRPGDVVVAINGQNLGGGSRQAAESLLAKLPAGLAVIVVHRGGAGLGSAAKDGGIAFADASRLGGMPTFRLLFGRDDVAPGLGFSCQITTSSIEGSHPPGSPSGSPDVSETMAIVTEVTLDSPAWRAGLRQGQLLLSVNDASLVGMTAAELETLVARMVQQVRVLNLLVASPPSADPSPATVDVILRRGDTGFGLRLTDRLASIPSERGLYIEDVLVPLHGDNADLIVPGMLVCRINGQSVLTLPYRKAMELFIAAKGVIRLHATRVEWPGKQLWSPPASNRSRLDAPRSLPRRVNAAELLLGPSPTASPERTLNPQRPILTSLEVFAQDSSLVSLSTTTAAEQVNLALQGAILQDSHQPGKAERVRPRFVSPPAPPGPPPPLTDEIDDEGEENEACDILGSSGSQLDLDGGLVSVVIEREVQQGLGFGVVGGRSKGGIYVGTVVPQGPAASHLRVGDHIVWANGKPLIQLDHNDAVTVLKSSPKNAKLLIERKADPTKEYITSSFYRKETGLGISLAGGAGSRRRHLFVKAIQSGSAAEQAGDLQPGDQLLAISNACLLGLTHEQAVAAFRSTLPEVAILATRKSTKRRDSEVGQPEYKPLPQQQVSLTPSSPPPRPSPSTARPEARHFAELDQVQAKSKEGESALSSFTTFST